MEVEGTALTCKTLPTAQPSALSAFTQSTPTVQIFSQIAKKIVLSFWHILTHSGERSYDFEDR